MPGAPAGHDSASPEVRRLLSSDAEAFRDIRLEGLRDYPEAFGASWAEEEAQPIGWFARSLDLGFVLGADIGDGELGGVAGLRFFEAEKTRHKARLWGMYVRPQSRGSGLGVRLIEGIIALARPRVEELTLTVGSHNQRAIARYASMGFEECGIERRALKVGDTYVDDLMMSLRFVARP